MGQALCVQGAEVVRLNGGQRQGIRKQMAQLRHGINVHLQGVGEGVAMRPEAPGSVCHTVMLSAVRDVWRMEGREACFAAATTSGCIPPDAPSEDVVDPLEQLRAQYRAEGWGEAREYLEGLTVDS